MLPFAQFGAGRIGAVHAALSLLLLGPAWAETHARNVILFLGDAGGLSTLNAASAYAYNRPQALFIQDMHADAHPLGLERTIVMDNLIRKIAATAPADTLIIFAADHSFDLRLRGGNRSENFRDQTKNHDGVDASPANSPLRVDHAHTGEEILVAAQGPGADRVRGFISNTGIFRIMMAAYGWDSPP